MSSLLEQAIIDATALKEAATKNAEKNLIDKYSDKIKEAVDKLLEQDLNISDASQDAGLENEQELDAASNLENIPSDLSGQNQNNELEKDPLEKIKSSFLSDDDDELITIDFSSLKVKPVEETPLAAPVEMPVSPPLAQPQAAPATPPVEAAPPAPVQEGLRQYEIGEEELAEEYEINLDEEMCEGGGCEEMNPSEPDVIVTLGEDDTYSPGESVESLEEGDEDLEEELDLDESLIVDMEGVSDGWRGTQPNERREIENVELAKLQDEEVQLKIREYEDALESTNKKIKKATKEKEVLMKENKELKTTLLSLKEHIEKMNLSNAKLLYMNRALGDFSLNERQKNQIVETISRSESVEGAKIAYEALQSSVQSAKKEIKAPKSLNEAVSKSSSPFLVRKNTQESTPYAERMKILAGIKN